MTDPPRVPPRRLLIGLGSLVVILMVGGAVSFVRYARSHAPNPSLVAGAPFDIFAKPELDRWRVGLAPAPTEPPDSAPLAALPPTLVTDSIAELNAALGDRYIIDRELGRGGMATVYLARDPKHERFLALKTLRPEIAMALGRERFLREIKLAARLQHQNILGVYDSGEAGGILYYVMPFVEGESLRDRLEREPQFPVQDALH